MSSNDATPDEPASLELTYITPTVTTDGSSISISTENDVPTLTFFQIRRQNGDALQADAVASVRMHGLNELRNLRDNIEEAIRNHENREK